MTLPSPESFPVVLEQVVFSRITVEAINGFQVNPSREGPLRVPIAPVNSFSLNPAQEGDRSIIYAICQVTFNASKDPQAPYFFEMECYAKFLVRDGVSEDQAKGAATITGHSVTYGAIREALAWMTGRLPYGPFLLGLSILRPATEPQNEPPEQEG